LRLRSLEFFWEVAAQIAFVKLIQNHKYTHHNPNDEENGKNFRLHLISLVAER